MKKDGMGWKIDSMISKIWIPPSYNLPKSMKVVSFNESFRYLGHQIRADGSGEDAMTNMTNTIKAMTNHMRKRTGDSPDAKYEVIKVFFLPK